MAFRVLAAGGSDAMNPYICGIFDLAEALPAGLLTTSKHHAAKFAPVLASASKEFVHHMILFECADQVAVDNNFTHNHVIPNCERWILRVSANCKAHFKKAVHFHA